MYGFAYNAETVNYNSKKKKTIKNKKVRNILNNIDNNMVDNNMVDNNMVDDNDSDNEMSNFQPTTNIVEGLNENMNMNENMNGNNNGNMNENISGNGTLESESDNLNNVSENYNHKIPYYTNMSNSNNNDEIIEKLDYMIHMLEENKYIESESVTEDILLYSFLGVFIIYVLDTFSRTGKYIR